MRLFKSRVPRSETSYGPARGRTPSAERGRTAAPYVAPRATESNNPRVTVQTAVEEFDLALELERLLDDDIASGALPSLWPTGGAPFGESYMRSCRTTASHNIKRDSPMPDWMPRLRVCVRVAARLVRHPPVGGQGDWRTGPYRLQRLSVVSSKRRGGGEAGARGVSGRGRQRVLQASTKGTGLPRGWLDRITFFAPRFFYL